jgi:hypothetical protein
MLKMHAYMQAVRLNDLLKDIPSKAYGTVEEISPEVKL